jgi:Tol biopolymer transport system component
VKTSTRDWALFATVAVAVIIGVVVLARLGSGDTKAPLVSHSPSPAATRVAVSSPTPNPELTTSPAAPTASAATQTLPTETYPGTLVITRISEPGENYDVYLVRSDGTGFRRLTAGSGNEEHAYWSPDGTRIVYAAESGIRVMNADGSGKVTLGAGGSPCWSPDGKQILYQPGDGLSVMNADGSDVQSLGLDISSRYATWAPNGMIVFVSGYTRGDSDAYAGGDLYAVHPDGTGLVRLTRRAGMILPFVSPDGSTIAAYVPREDRIIAVPYRAYGPPVTLLAHASLYFRNGGKPLAHWTADGKKLVLGSSNYGESGGAGIYIVNADGSGLTRIPNVKDAICPDWRPASAAP